MVTGSEDGTGARGLGMDTGLGIGSEPAPQGTLGKRKRRSARPAVSRGRSRSCLRRASPCRAPCATTRSAPRGPRRPVSSRWSVSFTQIQIIFPFFLVLSQGKVVSAFGQGSYGPYGHCPYSDGLYSYGLRSYGHQLADVDLWCRQLRRHVRWTCARPKHVRRWRRLT